MAALLCAAAPAIAGNVSVFRGQASAPALSGPALFQQRGCVQCHMIGRDGGNKGPDLTHVGKRLSETQLRQQILKGGGMMPPYEEALTPAEVAHLVHYLHGLR